MARILTFLGKGGTGRSTIAIAAAKQFAAKGSRVLFVSSDSSPALSLELGSPVGSEPQPIAANLSAVQLLNSVLLEQGWEEIKKLEAKYVRTPFLKAVYGQELGIVPGMESALTLCALRNYDQTRLYDVIIYDGSGDENTLRMIGAPEIGSWYVRRFRQVFGDSDVGKALSPFIQPVSSAVLNVDWSGDIFEGPTKEVTDVMEQWRSTMADSNRVVAYLVTTGNPAAIAKARYLWGSAQQIGLLIGGVVLNEAFVVDTFAAELAPNLQELYATYEREANVREKVSAEFAPLPVTAMPWRNGDDWETLINALPDFSKPPAVPKPIEINVREGSVSLFLPGFDKKQVKLTQYGPEVTIEAGDQRRNIFLPNELRGRTVKGAKFQNQYLIITFG